MMRRTMWLALVCVALTGCRHKAKPLPPIALPPSTPVPVDQAPEPPMVATVPVDTAPTPSIKLPVKRPPRPKAKPVQPAALPATVATAGPVAPAGSSIGALSTGGDDSPERRQKAVDLLTGLEKQVSALPADVVQKQREQVQRVRFFLAEAKKALDGGDTDGASTLGTKAKVLLDDLVK